MSWDDDDFDVALPTTTPAARPTATAAPETGDEEDKALTERPVVRAPAAAPAAADMSKPKHAARKADEELSRKHEDAGVRVQGRPFSEPELEKLRMKEIEVATDLEAARDGLGGDSSEAASAGFLNALSCVSVAADATSVKLFARASLCLCADAAGSNKSLLLTFLEEAIERSIDRLSADDLKKLRAKADAASMRKAQREKEEEKAKKKVAANAKKSGLRSAAVEAASEYDFGGDLGDDVDGTAAAAPGKRYGADDEESFM